MEPDPTVVRIGVLVTGDVAVRAAHSLEAHPGITAVVVIGPARSKSFEVVPDATGCDLLVGTGPEAPGRARRLGVGLVWDGDRPEPGVAVHGASPLGLGLALAARESEPGLVAVAHPDLGEGAGRQVRFPDPIGPLRATDGSYGGRIVALAKSPNVFAACLTVGLERRVAIVDEAPFLAGVALAAGTMVSNGVAGPVWSSALPYLQAAAAMGLVLADDR